MVNIVQVDSVQTPKAPKSSKKKKTKENKEDKTNTEQTEEEEQKQESPTCRNEVQMLLDSTPTTTAETKRWSTAMVYTEVLGFTHGEAQLVFDQGLDKKDGYLLLPQENVKSVAYDIGLNAIKSVKLLSLAAWIKENSVLSIGDFTEEVMWKVSRANVMKLDKGGSTKDGQTDKKGAITPDSFNGNIKTWQIFRRRFEGYATTIESIDMLRHSKERYENDKFVDPLDPPSMNGPNFLGRNRALYGTLKSLLCGGTAWSLIQKYDDPYFDGRTAWITLCVYYEGPLQRQAISKSAMNDLTTSLYPGHSRNRTFDDYVALHNSAHYQLETINAPQTEEMRRVWFLQGITADELQPAKEAISASREPWSFERLVAYMKQKVQDCLLYTSPSPRDQRGSRMPSSA